MPRRIRILHVLHTFKTGGLENGIVNLINASPDHLVHELCFLHRGGELLQRLTKPVRYYELHRRNGNDVRLILRLCQLFRGRNVDVIHTRNWAAFDAILAACLMLKPIVIHSEHGRDITDPHGTNRRRNLARRAAAVRMKKFVAVSKNLYDWLKLTVRIPERKLVLIPNGVDTQRFRPREDSSVRTELGIASNEIVVGTVGRLDPIKNHEGLVRVVQSLNVTDHKVRLVIVGDGPNRTKIQNLLQTNSAPQPLLLDARADIERIYRAFDVFVLNSFGEGMSNTLLEAMSMGLPVICTAVGGNPELVSDQERGLLVKPGENVALAEAIREYINSPEKRKAHGINARSFVARYFSLEQMIHRYVALYESAA